MEKVVKRTIGYGKPKEKENYTHVIYTDDEHNKKEQKIRELEYKIEKLEREYKSAIERYKIAADDKVDEIQHQADERVAEAQAEANKYKDNVARLENMNRNLIRVATERANAQRGLTPKKQHIGYIFLNVDEYVYNCECYLAENSAKGLIESDFKNKKIYDMLGIKLNFNIENWIEKELIDFWSTGKDNFIFRITYKANIPKGFWEGEYLSRYMPVIPMEMVDSKNKIR